MGKMQTKTFLRTWTFAVFLLGIGLWGCNGQSTPNTPSENPTENGQMAVDTPVAPPTVELRAEEIVFEKEIVRFEEMEAENPSEKGGILFTGSSSIRMWKTLTEDMAPLPVTNRGFGGSTLRQVHAYAERIALPLEPKLIVLYCGENDISNEVYTANEVHKDFLNLVAYFEHFLPKTPILYLSMKPSLARWDYWPKFQESNRLIQESCEQNELLTFVDVGEVMLKGSDEPDPNIFIRDKLHMNAEGYRRWTELIKPLVEDRYQP